MSLIVDIKKKLDDFHLCVSFETSGDINALFGLSGSGKSVTLKCIAGILKPDFGRIIIDNTTVFDSERKINLSPQKRNVGYLPQHYALFPNMTVKQNILTGLHSISKNERIYMLEHLIESFKLSDIKDKFVHQISGGEKQRVALARALATNPKVLLLDEPFSALDSQLKSSIEIDLINTLEKFTGDVVFVSHDKDEIYRICDKVSVIESGYCNNIRSTDSIFNSPVTKADAVLIGIENICNVVLGNDRYFTEFGFDFSYPSDDIKSIGFNMTDNNINSDDFNIFFDATIINIIQDINGSLIVMKISDFSKPILLKSLSRGARFTKGKKLTVGLNISDIHCFK
ncbi:MAG: ATP-binding cassette domain-containing protein [Ruminococcaceae bacterium]|nr:ATP-binding cassette domain-containing protein [Oscillospiraceae bacterium]